MENWLHPYRIRAVLILAPARMITRVRYSHAVVAVARMADDVAAAAVAAEHPTLQPPRPVTT